MSSRGRDLVETVGISYVSSVTDPIETAAEHPLLQKVVRLDFRLWSEAQTAVQEVREEFMFSDEQIIKSMCRCNEILYGVEHGQA